MFELIQAYFSQAPQFGWNAFWISQGLVGIALVSDLISYQMKRREHVLGFFVFSTTLIALHLYLLEQHLAAAILSLAAIRFLVSIFTTHKALLYIFLVLTTLIAVVMYKTPLDLLAWICSLIFTCASFRATDKALRQTMMCGTSLWIVYQVLIFSPAAIILETSFLLSNFAGYYRYYIRGAKT